MRGIVVMGGANSGSLVAQAIADLAAAGEDVFLAGFLNDDLSPGGELCGSPVLGGFEDWRDLTEELRFIAAVHKAGRMREHARRVDGLGVPAERWASIRHPRSVVAADAAIGPGTFVGPNALVMPRARVGSHVSLRGGCYVSHGVTVGSHAFIGPNAVVNGESTVGEGAFVGPGAVVRDGIRVGAFATVGLGAVAFRDVPDGATVVGNPARPIPATRPHD